MLSIFPALLTGSLAAPTILRLVASLILIQHGHQSTQMNEGKRRWAGAIEIALAFLLLIGLFTQPVALVLAILITARPDKQILVTARLLMITVLLSLVLTGPGLFAFDLPL
ncbi:hypothetical protein IT398_01055 [Candidatus Nomurabacteria bacterium]|nr:hypothetical protein [Candidatus Nomurabacteria bacterium]